MKLKLLVWLTSLFRRQSLKDTPLPVEGSLVEALRILAAHGMLGTAYSANTNFQLLGVSACRALYEEAGDSFGKDGKFIIPYELDRRVVGQ